MGKLIEAAAALVWLYVNVLAVGFLGPAARTSMPTPRQVQVVDS